MTQPHWLDPNEYPFHSHFLTVEGHKMHYIDEGTGPVILFIHGTPSWSFDFRKVIQLLRNTHRCIAIDHMGFGLSDKPEKYAYTLHNHIKNMEQLVHHLRLPSFTMVVHDFGGPIGFSLAEKYPEKTTGFVVINSWMWSSSGEKEFKKLQRILKNPLLPLLYKYFNFSAKVVLPASFGDNKLTAAIHRQYTRPLASPAERNGTIGFARSLLLDQDFFESLWQNKNVIASRPMLLIWGMKDKLLGEEYLRKFQSGFPNSTAVKIATAGHFPQEEQGAFVAENIKLFLST